MDSSDLSHAPILNAHTAAALPVTIGRFDQCKYPWKVNIRLNIAPRIDSNLHANAGGNRTCNGFTDRSRSTSFCSSASIAQGVNWAGYCVVEPGRRHRTL